MIAVKFQFVKMFFEKSSIRRALGKPEGRPLGPLEKDWEKVSL